MKVSYSVAIFLFTCTGAGAQTSDSAQFYFKKGMEEKSARHYLAAGNYFDKATALDPKFSPAFIEAGKVNLEMKKPDAALTRFVSANLLEPSNNEVIRELSLLYFNNRQFSKAIEMAQKCKGCPEAGRIIGISDYNQQEYGQAVVQLQKALATFPADAELQYTLGRSYLELEQEDKAIPFYQKAIALDTSKNSWVYELGLIYYSLEHYADAVKYFIRAADAGYPASNDYYENIGFAYLYSNDIENGIMNLSKVLAAKPDNASLLTGIAEAMYKSKRYDEALHYYQKLMELNSGDAKALYMAGIIYLRKGEKEKGQALCDKAISMDPSLAEKRQKKEGQFGL